MWQDLKLTAETSEVSTEGIALEHKSERDITVVEDDKNKETEQVCSKARVPTTIAETFLFLIIPTS